MYLRSLGYFTDHVSVERVGVMCSATMIAGLGCAGAAQAKPGRPALS